MSLTMPSMRRPWPPPPGTTCYDLEKGAVSGRRGPSLRRVIGATARRHGLTVADLADALGACGVQGVEIAWPNDVLSGDAKVAGILCEMSADQERVAWAVAGMGINVGPVPDVPGSRWTPGSLAALGTRPRRGDLLVAALGAIGRRYEAWLEHGPAGAVAAFGRRDHLAARRVTVGTPSGDITGIGCGIDSLGRLVIDVDGDEVALSTGEVTGVDRR